MVRLITNGGGETGDTSLGAPTAGVTAVSTPVNTGTLSWQYVTPDPVSGVNHLPALAGALGTTYYLRGVFRVPVWPGVGKNTNFLVTRDSVGAFPVAARMNPAGEIYLWNSPGAVQVGAASAAQAVDTWFTVELGFRFAASTGDDYAELRVNGVSVASSSTLTLTANAPSGLRVGNFTNNVAIGYTVFVDDYALNDSTGVADNTWPGVIGGVPGQFARPTTDVTDGTWTDQAGGVSLFAAIDEVTASDADYIQSAVATLTADVAEIALGTITDPAVSTGHVVRYRYGKDTAAGDVVNLTVSLRQGTATEIASWTHAGLSEVTATVSQTLTAAQADAITDYTALRLRFSAIKA